MLGQYYVCLLSYGWMHRNDLVQVIESFDDAVVVYDGVYKTRVPLGAFNDQFRRAEPHEALALAMPFAAQGATAVAKCMEQVIDSLDQLITTFKKARFAMAQLGDVEGKKARHAWYKKHGGLARELGNVLNDYELGR